MSRMSHIFKDLQTFLNILNVMGPTCGAHLGGEGDWLYAFLVNHSLQISYTVKEPGVLYGPLSNLVMAGLSKKRITLPHMSASQRYNVEGRVFRHKVIWKLALAVRIISLPRFPYLISHMYIVLPCGLRCFFKRNFPCGLRCGLRFFKRNFNSRDGRAAACGTATSGEGKKSQQGKLQNFHNKPSKVWFKEQLKDRSPLVQLLYISILYINIIKSQPPKGPAEEASRWSNHMCFVGNP